NAGGSSGHDRHRGKADGRGEMSAHDDLVEAVANAIAHDKELDDFDLSWHACKIAAKTALAAYWRSEMTDIPGELQRLIGTEEKSREHGVAEMVRAMRVAYVEIERLREAVRAEREAILELIEAQRSTLRIYDGDYALQTVAAAIRARGNQP